jgi:hypothetical protein
LRVSDALRAPIHTTTPQSSTFTLFVDAVLAKKLPRLS